MGLSGSIGSLLSLINSRRVLALQGHYGSYKTALSFRLAIELCEQYGYQHIVSNCASVIADDVHEIELDEDGRLNAIIILDEAGEFIEKKADTKGWLAFLRKMNVCLLLPTVDHLPKNVTRLELSLTDDFQSLGANLVTFGISLDGGMTKDEKFKVNWHNPSEIYGLYDTDAFPSDADEILSFIREKTAKAAKSRGYEKTAMKYQVRSVFGGSNEQISTVETIGGQVNGEQTVQTGSSGPVSISLSETSPRHKGLLGNTLSRLAGVLGSPVRRGVANRAFSENGSTHD